MRYDSVNHPSFWFFLAFLVLFLSVAVNWDQTPRECNPMFCVMNDDSYRLSPENHVRYIEGDKVDLRTFKR